MAFFLAYLLEPVVQLNRKWLHMKGRIVAALLTLLEMGMIFTTLYYIFAPTVMKDLTMLNDIIKSIEDGSRVCRHTTRKY